MKSSYEELYDSAQKSKQDNMQKANKSRSKAVKYRERADEDADMIDCIENNPLLIKFLENMIKQTKDELKDLQESLKFIRKTQVKQEAERFREKYRLSN